MSKQPAISKEQECDKDSVIIDPNIPPVHKDWAYAKVLNLYAEADLLRIIRDYILDFLPRQGHRLNHTWTDLPNIVCLIALVLGCYIQFGMKAPQENTRILCGVICYFLITSSTVVFHYLVTKQSLVRFYDKENSCWSSLDVSIPSLSGELLLGVRSGGRKVERRVAVKEFFDEEGYFIHRNVFDEVNNLMGSSDKKRD